MTQNIREQTTVLSESNNGRNILVLGHATQNTLVHTVPDGEIHEITLYASNPSNFLNEIDGLWGGDDPVDDMLKFTMDPETTRPALVRNAVLVGPATIKLRSKFLPHVLVFGKVVVYVQVGN